MMLKRYLISILLAASTTVIAQHEFYVAPTGSDTNIGTREQPFKSLQRAKEAVADSIPSMTRDISVIFASGAYPITQTVAFGPEDSPKGNFTITYKAAKGHTPLFTGGVPVTGWSKYHNNLWRAPLKRDHKLRALYVNDQRAVMACGKKLNAKGGWGEYAVKAGQADWAWKDGKVADGVKYSVNDLPNITRNPSDVEIENRTIWNKNFIGVRQIVREGGFYVFKLQQPYGAIAQQIGYSAGLRVNGQHIIHNAFELLDEPGEFYFDRKEGMVYYYPRPGDDMNNAQVVAPVTETLMRIEGEVPDRPVRNLIFDGLSFAHSDYNLMDIDGSVGKATAQTSTINVAFATPNWHLDAYRAYDVLPGAIIANGVENVEFIRNTISHTGCEALAMNNGVKNIRVIGNTIYDAGGSAIAIGHPQHIYENDTADLKHPDGAGVDKEKYQNGTESVPRDVLIADNFLPGNAALFNGHTVITVFFANGVRIEHNWIPNAPYSGISVGWGWSDFDGVRAEDVPNWGYMAGVPAVIPDKPTTVAGNNIIRANRIEDTMSILVDGGGIYTLGNMPGSIIEYNYVRKTEQAIYTDEGSGNIISRYNVIEDPFKLAHYADSRGRKKNITIEHFFVTSNRFKIGAVNTVSRNHTVCNPSNWPRKAQDIINASGLSPKWNYLATDWEADQEERRQAERAHQLEQSVKSGLYEAELAELTGGASVNTNNKNYSGTGFVDGQHNSNSAKTTFTVKATDSGHWPITLRYAAGNGDCTNIGFYVNDRKLKTLKIPKTGGWSTWADLSGSVSLNEGWNTISFKTESRSEDNINIDYLKLSL